MAPKRYKKNQPIVFDPDITREMLSRQLVYMDKRGRMIGLSKNVNQLIRQALWRPK